MLMNLKITTHIVNCLNHLIYSIKVMKNILIKNKNPSLLNYIGKLGFKVSVQCTL